jgi:hypothetical protein
VYRKLKLGHQDGADSESRELSLIVVRLALAASSERDEAVNPDGTVALPVRNLRARPEERAESSVDVCDCACMRDFPSKCVRIKKNPTPL